MEKNACEAKQKLYRFRRIDFGPLIAQILFKKLRSMVRCAGDLFLYFTTRTEKASLFRQRRLGPQVFLWYAILVWLRVGEERNQAGLGQLHPMARMRSTRRRLLSSEMRLNRRSLFLYGTWRISSSVGSYELSVSEHWLALYNHEMGLTLPWMNAVNELKKIWVLYVG